MKKPIVFDSASETSAGDETPRAAAPLRLAVMLRSSLVVS